jgi:membrane protease YdiL (CAAX protease family)
VSVTAPGTRGPTPDGWKGLLALLSLSLCGLLWWNGLQQSLERPSVNDTLTIRQLELAVQAGSALPGSLAEGLGEGDPRAALARELRKAVDAEAGPPVPERALELALLEEPTAAAGRLADLAPQVPPDQRALITALRRSVRPAAAPAEVDRLLAPWPLSPLARQLACERLAGDPSGCTLPGAGRSALLRWLAVSLGPLLLLVLGVGLLVVTAWRRWRGTAPAVPPLRAPPLSLADVAILIAGGFVVVGEGILPWLLFPAVQSVLAPLAQRPALARSLEVLLLYGGVMGVTLLLLWLMLRPAGIAPAAGWLQWRWRPIRSGVTLALAHVLMVLPLVTLGGWLIEQIWNDPSGSNPLLDLVLTTGDPLALAALVLTATVLAPVFEETLFRGVLLPVLGRRLGGGWAVLLSALAFGLAHGSLSELAPLALLGLALGWLRLGWGRLAPCVLMHAFWNGITFVNLLLLS